ncbi:hypothetical protein GGR95_001607 [Sulfitobacter undariae]|uniref:Alpha/beta hydrolase family protein n=1 Tax=Sulfitobacter undariae TaxID=1563671 RepID=A0A7W6GZJ2_9RHOB|nr:hypothetical protein [Sulfitobacter undariae]MBB3993976.1 hypothetical protein [Sulfitobacter undariae]
MAAPAHKPVTKRAVFYIPGYDPIHPRRYRELYRSESAAQAEISGYGISLSARQGGARYGWDVKGLINGAHVDASVDVLVWSDIVRDSMNTSVLATYAQLLQTAWVYIGTGALWRLMRLRKGPVIAALYPIGMLLLQLIFALVVGGLVSAAVSTWVLEPAMTAVLSLFSQNHVALAFMGALALTSVVAWGIFFLVAWRILHWFKSKDGKLFAYYLMHDYAYGAATRGANTPQLEARMAEFGAAIGEALASDVDEVLVVGHSSGAHLGVSVLADLIRQGHARQDGPALGFLSLGQVVPMVSFLPNAQRLRADLAYLSAQERLSWVDVTAPGDGCAFALCDPVSVSGVAPADKRWPLVFSAAFTQTLSPARWKKLRWRFFRLHFQYLCAFDRPRDYDYFRITAGALSLAERYADRPASKSRIEKPVNKFTSMTL